MDLEDAGLEAPGGQAEEAPPVLHYSPVVARLEMVADRILAVRTAVQAGYTREHQEPSFQPLPRPVTAVDRERERRTRTVLLELNDLVLGEGLMVSSSE